VRRTTSALTALLLAATLGLAACGDDSETTSEPGDNATQSAPATPDAANAECSNSSTVPAASKDVGEAPEIAKPTGPPPCELVIEDLVVGTGAEVANAETQYLWNYEGVAWSTGEIFDSSFQRGQPAPFSLSQVIPGWQEGLADMKVGGRRQLVIPPDLAYGEAGAGAAIGPNETLVFVVDLVGPAS
jgi:peptidylprolyl isomerase